MLIFRFDFLDSEGKVLLLRTIAGILLGTWLLLVFLLGKGGFVHLLLLSGIGVVVVETVRMYRSRMEI